MYTNLGVCFFISAFGLAHTLNITTRDEWGARAPTSFELMVNPVPFVVIHHSIDPYVFASGDPFPRACTTQSDCIAAMHQMQNWAMDVNIWADIAYNFVVGGDGNAYEGRGWTKVGVNAPGYNLNSVGICLIGDWMEELPPENQLRVVKELIQLGVDLGMVSGDYQLIGHREATGTSCPGDKLYEEISTWDHFIDI